MITVARMPQALRGRGLDFLALLLLLAVIALTGGTSRPDSPTQTLVRGAALVAIAGWTVVGWPRHRAGLGWPGAFFLAALAITGLQLVPLPPSLWSALPGREIYERTATVIGIDQPWRPVNLVPDRGIAAFFSLAVPGAVLVGLSRLVPRDRAGLLTPMLVLVMLSAVLGLAQLSTGADSALRWYRVSNDQSAVGFFANRNHQALLLAFGLPIGAAWAVADQRGDRPWLRGWIALAIGAFLILMLPTTGSRAGLGLGAVGLLVAAALAGPVAYRRWRRLRRAPRHRMAAIAAAGVVAFVAVLLLYGRNEALVRLQDLNAGEDMRARSLPVVWRMAMEFFPAGSGFGTFDTMYRRFEPFSQLSTTYLNQAHNDLLQLVLEGGLLAVAVAVAFLLWWAWASLRVWRSPLSPRVAAGRAGSAMLAMTVAASAVDYPLRAPLMLAIFALAGGWLGAAALSSGTAGSGGEAVRRDAEAGAGHGL